MMDTSIQQKAQYVGNNLKSMHISVETSLKRLRTSYIDILYVHWVCPVSCQDHHFGELTRAASGTGPAKLKKS